MDNRIIRPKVSAVIRSSGVKSPVKWIDLKTRRCRTKDEFEGDLEEFYFVDDRDYDSLRGEFAGRAMQGFLSCARTQDLYRNVHVYAVKCADRLIEELKRPRDYMEFFGLKERKEGKEDGQ